MFYLITLLKGLLYLIAIPLYFSWFYFIYYMIFKDLKIGAIFFVANIVIGYIITFIIRYLTSCQLKAAAKMVQISENQKQARIAGRLTFW